MDDRPEVEVIRRTPKILHHLEAIDFFESLAEDIETNHKGNDWLDLDSSTQQQYRMATTSSIIRAVAFLDATANEMLYRLITDKDNLIDFSTHPNLRGSISQSEAERISNKQLPTLDRFNTILSKAGHTEISAGHSIGQEADCVVDFRNHVIHHEAVPLSIDTLPSNIASLPKDIRFSNQFIVEHMNPLDKCLSSGTIAWAADTCFDFAEEFFDRLDIESDLPSDVRSLDEVVIDENPARPYIIGLDELEHQYR